MRFLNIFLFYVFLIFCCTAETEINEKDELISITPPPIVLQLSQSIQSENNENLQQAAHTPGIEDQLIFRNVSNDVEVFREKLEQQNERQEEEPAVAAEAQPETEKPNDEETPEPESEPTANEENEPAEGGGEVKPAPEAEETADVQEELVAEPETPKDDVPAEPEVNNEAEVEPEPEQKPKPVENDAPPNASEMVAENEMPNDEPAKEEKTEEAKTSVSKDTDIKDISCYACTSSEDSKCSVKSTQQIPCPKVNKGDTGKHNGCYTLFQADINVTMRGCVDDLAESGLKYCLTNEKLCTLCYSNGCNNKLAPSNATKLLLNTFYMLVFTICSTLINEFPSFYFK